MTKRERVICALEHRTPDRIPASDSFWDTTLLRWKQEGFPEYIANIGLLRTDSSHTLPERIDILLDDGMWLGLRSWDRIHYEAGILVEFLLDVQGMGLRGVLDERVTPEKAYSEMLEWFRARTNRSAAAFWPA